MAQAILKIKKIEPRIDDSNTIRITEKPSAYPEQARWLGLTNEFKYIDNWFESKKEGLWIRGMGGSGKTSLVKTWITGLNKIGYRNSLDISLFTYFCYQDNDASRLLDELKAWLRRESEKRKIINLDGVEVFDGEKLRSLIELILHHDKTCKLIVTSRTDMKLLGRSFDFLLLGGMVQDDFMSMFQEIIIDEDIKLNLYHMTDGNALMMSLLYTELKKGRHDALELIEMMKNDFR